MGWNITKVIYNYILNSKNIYILVTEIMYAILKNSEDLSDDDDE